MRERRELVSGQHPYAIVLSCSDSRVPPEEVFDESLGKLFVVRVAYRCGACSAMLQRSCSPDRVFAASVDCITR